MKGSVWSNHESTMNFQGKIHLINILTPTAGFMQCRSVLLTVSSNGSYSAITLVNMADN